MSLRPYTARASVAKRMPDTLLHSTLHTSVSMLSDSQIWITNYRLRNGWL